MTGCGLDPVLLKEIAAYLLYITLQLLHGGHGPKQRMRETMWIRKGVTPCLSSRSPLFISCNVRFSTRLHDSTRFSAGSSRLDSSMLYLRLWGGTAYTASFVESES